MVLPGIFLYNTLQNRFIRKKLNGRRKMKYENFGTTLKELRKKRGLTQEQLAEYLGISSQAVSKWENNISYPDVSLLPVLANYFQVSTDELLGVDTAKRAESIQKLCLAADSMIAEGKYAEAVAKLRLDLVQYPVNDQLLYRLAWALTGTIREHPQNLDEAILIYLKILETSSDATLKLKAMRDLMYRYYTKGEEAFALHYAEQLPTFELCLKPSIRHHSSVFSISLKSMVIFAANW